MGHRRLSQHKTDEAFEYHLRLLYLPLLLRRSCQTAPLIYCKVGSFLVYIIAIRLFLNHSPSEWFSGYKKDRSFSLRSHLAVVSLVFT